MVVKAKFWFPSILTSLSVAMSFRSRIKYSIVPVIALSDTIIVFNADSMRRPVIAVSFGFLETVSVSNAVDASGKLDKSKIFSIVNSSILSVLRPGNLLKFTFVRALFFVIVKESILLHSSTETVSNIVRPLISGIVVREILFLIFKVLSAIRPVSL